MSAPEGPPPGSRARLEPDGDGFTLLLPPVGFQGQRRSWALCLAVLVLVTAFSVAGWAMLGGARNLGERVCSVLFLVMGLVLGRMLVVLVTAHTLDASLGRVTLVVAGRRLYAHRRGLRAREWVWDEGEITALDEELGGLWVAGPGRPQKLFAERDVAELRWVARLLRQALGVSDTPPPRPGEIPVRCTVGPERHVWRGFLRARPGRLAVRHVFSPDIRLPFRTGRPVRRTHLNEPSPLEPDNVRWPADGHCLEIVFTMVEEDYTIQIESDDPGALRAAVAHFWEVHEPERAPDGLPA